MRTRFRLTIDSRNAAMVEDPEGEVARLLEVAAGYVRNGATNGSLRDWNGNEVGTWTFTPARIKREDNS